MKTIFILMDSLNRHYLPVYGNDWVKTPNLDRLAEKSAVFQNHYMGSAPCMPARRELLTGRVNFLETPWCPLQPFDLSFTDELRTQKGVYSHMITDHYHYWEYNGLGYNTVFDTWEFIRGQEGDPWHPSVSEPDIPVYRGKNRRQDWVNRESMNLERDLDYPTPQCFERAIDFLDKNDQADNWHLHLEVFDPHEPFLTPEKYRQMYHDTWDKPFHFDWPDYQPVNTKIEGEEAIHHIQKYYAALVTRTDVWLGKLLDKMDELDAWQDTAVILTTDHGHLLGEHGYWAKNYMFDYNEIAHIPLMMVVPGSSSNRRRINALTTTVDLMPTLMELHEAQLPANIHGKSLLPLVDQDGQHHSEVLYGYFGKDVNLTDGRYTYCRQPLEGSAVHHFTSCPVGARKNKDDYAKAETGCFLKHVPMPVYKITQTSVRHMHAPDHHLIYDLSTDPSQQQPIHDVELEHQLERKLTKALEQLDAPDCQYHRLGLDRYPVENRK